MRRKPKDTYQGRQTARQNLRTGDRKLAERALKLTIACRAKPNDPLPLTVGWMQRVCKQIGRPVGEHRAARMIHHLQRKHLRDAGSYKARRHGFHVRLYLVAPGSLSVRSRRAVKELPWWKHPLFGNPEGVIPPLMRPGCLERWASPPYLAAEREREVG